MTRKKQRYTGPLTVEVLAITTPEAKLKFRQAISLVLRVAARLEREAGAEMARPLKPGKVPPKARDHDEP